MRSNKQRLWQAYKRNRTNQNLVIYKKANAIFKRAAKTAKRKKFEDLTSNINPTTSPKKIWGDIKMLTGSPRISTFSHINSSSRVLFSPADISDFFASYFSSFSSNTSFSDNFRNEKVAALNSSFSCSFRLSTAAKQIEADIQLSEFEYAFSSVKGKTPGLDRISYPMIRNSPTSVKLRLINLFNNILDSGSFPQSWKLACIVPILKPNKTASEVDSYRPISLLSCLGKLFEKIIVNRLMWYADNKILLSPNQAAYRKHHGPIDCLIHIDHFISNALSSRNHISLLSIDFQKAFDRIGIHIIMRQLDI